MLKEGVGIVAPKPVPIRLTDGEVALVRSAAAERRRYRNYANRTDAWGRGLIADPVLIGMSGELAVIVFLNRRLGLSLSLDTELLRKGDGGHDLPGIALPTQIKTRKTRSANNLIRRVSRKSIKPLDAKYFIFCQYVDERTVHILGWLPEEQLRLAPFHKSPLRQAEHFNLDVPDSWLLPMQDYLDELEARGAV